MKLNLGSGKDYKKGFINLDINKQYNPDLVFDLRKRFPFKENSIDEIKAFDILEHFTREDGEKFLKECCRALQVGGIITIRTPNIRSIYAKFKHDPDVLIHFLYGNTSESGEFGCHKFAYTKNSLSRVLKKIGLNVIDVQEEETNFLFRAEKDNPKNHNLTIGIIQQTPGVGGAENFMLNLINEFRQSKNKIFLATNNNNFAYLVSSEVEKLYKIPLVLDIIGNFRGFLKSLFLLPFMTYYYISLLIVFKKNKVDVLLMSGFSEKLLVSFLSVFFKMPVVWIEYGPLSPILKKNFYLPKILYKLTASIPKFVIVPSSNTKTNLITENILSLSQLRLIPCGVKIGNASRKLKIKNKFIIGNVSTLSRKKGQAYLIKAMSYLIKKMPNVYLFLIGEGPDRAYFERLAEDLGVSEYIKMAGFVKDIDKFYAMMDIFIFPTVWDMEGFGLVITEAMAKRIPVAASDFGPVPEILENGKTGILFKPRDEKAIAEAILSIYKSKGLTVESAYKKVRRVYDIKKIAKIYQEVLYEATL